MSTKSVDIRLYRRGVELRVESDTVHEGFGGKRGVVVGLSDSSRRRLGWLFANGGPWVSMLTLTYHRGFPPSGVQSKRHLKRVLDELVRDGIGYLWVVEWQARGYPHYHIWLSRLVEDWRRYMHVWLRATVAYNGAGEAQRFHLHERAYTEWNSDLSIGYACKYAAKQAQKWLPVGVEAYGRWWGTSRECVQCDTREVMPEGQGALWIRRNLRRAMSHWWGKDVTARTNQSLRWVLTESRRCAVGRLVAWGLTMDGDGCI